MPDKTILNKSTSTTGRTSTVEKFTVPKELHSGFSLADIIVEPDLGLIIRNSQPYHLAPKAMEILLFLAASNCEIVSREQILAFGWGDESASKTNITHIISEIRHALDDHKECPRFIQTIPRKGYRMMLPTLAKPSSGLFNFSDNNKSQSLKNTRWRLFNNANNNKFFGQQFLIYLIFAVIALVVVYYLSNHLTTYMEVETEQHKNSENTPQNQVVIDNAVAVLSFTAQNSTLSEHKLPVYAVSGLQEELINYLAQKSSFKVTSMRATNDLSKDASIDEIQARLGVRYILEGKARQEQSIIIVNTSLIDSVTGFQVWGVETSAQLTQVLSLYAELSRKVANALHLLIPGVDESYSNNQSSMPTNNFEAYDAYLQGKNEYRKTKSINSLITAENLFNMALKLDPEFINALAALCFTYLELYQLGKDPAHYIKGVEVCDLTASYQSQSVESYLSLGKLSMIRGKQQEAIKYLEQALVIDNQATVVITTLAEVYFDLEDNNKAEELYTQAIELEPTYWRNYYQFGVFLYYIGQYERAILQFNKVNSLNNNVANSYNALGGAYYLLMDWENASIAWSKALAIEPTALTYSNLATSLFFLKQFDNAAEIYLQGTKLTPNDNTIWANLGDSYKYSTIQNEHAPAAYNKALQLALKKELINPNDETNQSQIARYYSELKQCSVADSYVQTVLKKSPADPYIFYSLALVFLNCKRILEAENMIENAITLGYPKELLLVDPQFLVYKEQLSKLFNN
ncbi:winged helix-turn-helix domain-containing protein [Thalassotalea fonticola]|uniref:Winged helix-turn-helix domain-containing protein n=1 Tax=Thalassotalea fonticola TaxID=3065649 RepID=A0ABZ0GPP0_9GAMM|nr:winged helix-turn-helix domain-containing protein [Colwelliaceae bacterium S1-1]